MSTALYIIPPVGSSGNYVFNAPFSNLALPDDSYTCRAVRKLSDYVANNEDAYTNVYLAAGLTQANYQSDLAVDMPIASLQSQIGHWLYVPVSYIQSLPQNSGVPYQNMVLAVNIGAVPVGSDLTFLIQAISNVVADSYGVTPQIKEVVTSKTSIVPYATDSQVQNARKGRITNSTTDTAKYRALLVQYNNAITQLQALENYIVANRSKLGI
jgi:hypothetical protein